MNVSKRSPLFPLSLVALGVAACISSASADDKLETVKVIGQAVQMDKALDEQRLSNRVESVVHADGIGQLPDDNAAEALQRLPGVSVEPDQGEGRFVTVRGLAPEYNSVTINGTTLPAPEDGTRAVALDVLPSELIQSLTVVKTLTPDMDANSLGGTVEVESLSAFDHDDRFFSINAEAHNDDNTGETSPKLSGAFSNIFSMGGGEKNLGVAAALSWQERDFGSDNVETGGAWDFEEGALLEETEQRDYDITRERLGFGLNFDWRANDNTDYYLRTLYSEFTDTETRHAAGFEFADAVAVGEAGTGEGYRELKDRKETQNVTSYVLGGEKRMGAWTVSGQLGYGRSGEDSPEHIPGAKFVSNDDISDVSIRSSNKPVLDASDAYYDTAAFSLDEVEWEKQKTTDTEQNFKFDLERAYDFRGKASSVKFGGKISRREKDNDLEAWVYGDFGDQGIADDDLLLSAFADGTVDYSLNRFGTGISSSAIRRLLAQLDADENYDEEESTINDFVINEDINAAYVMNTIDFDNWTLIAGLRYEQTDMEAKGTGLRDDAFEAVTETNSYNNLLPGLHARYYLSDNTEIRAAWTNSVVRPTFEALSPGFVIDGEEASFGNPDLDPMESSNIDFGVEHYLNDSGIVSAFVFYKDIENFVYETDVAGTGIWADFDEAATFANGETASVSGLELTYTQKLTSLPAPWNGLLVGANLTLVDSDAEISSLGVSRDIALPGQSDTVGNLMLGWENDQLSVKLSANHKSEYLSEISDIEDESLDLYVDAQTFVDLSASYFLTKNAQITFEAKNLSDEVFYVYTGQQAYNAQYEEYGPSYKVSFTYNGL